MCKRMDRESNWERQRQWVRLRVKEIEAQALRDVVGKVRQMEKGKRKNRLEIDREKERNRDRDSD